MGIDIDFGGDPDNQPPRRKGLVRELTTSEDLEILRLHPEPPEDSVFRELVPNIFGSRQAAWNAARRNAGFEGDCRHIWEKVLDMPLTELIEKRETIKLPSPEDLSEAFLNIEPDQLSAGIVEKQKTKLQKAQDKFDMVTGTGIKRLAGELSFKNPTLIREWGSQLALAKKEAFHALHEENLRISLQASIRAREILKDLASLVRANKPGKWSLSGAFLKAKSKVVTPRQKDYFTADPAQKVKRKDRLIDYRLMSEEQKKEREELLLKALEDNFSSEMGKEEDKTIFAENALEVVEVYEMLARTYQKALKMNRQRTISEESASLSKSNASEEFRLAASRIQNDIDSRIDDLQIIIDSCMTEHEHYLMSIAFYQDKKRKMSGYVNDTLESVRSKARLVQRVMIEQNIMAAGQYAKGLDRYDQEKQIRITTTRIRKDMFREIRELIKTRTQMESDEALLLDHKDPIALIEHKKEILALPAPERKAKAMQIGEPE